MAAACKSEEAAAAVATPLPRKQRHDCQQQRQQFPPRAFSEELEACCAFGVGAEPQQPAAVTPSPSPALSVGAVITGELSTLDRWYHRFSARAIACRRRDTVLATVMAVSSCVLATLGGVPALSSTSNGPVLAAVGAAVALMTLVCQAVGRVCQWDTGAVQCRLAAQRCLGLKARVTAELVAEDQHQHLLDTLRLMQAEMQNIHQSEATCYLNGELETGRPPALALTA